jgi:hypothetical protein
MNKAVKIVGAIVALVVIGFIGRCTYMILCISCTTPAIKTYSYDGSMDQFESEFKKFAALHNNMNLKISRRDSSCNICARDITVELKAAQIIKYDLVLYKFNTTTKVALDDIYDETHKIGGNSTDDKATKELFYGFKNNFLVQLEKDQRLTLTPDFFNF